jgi:nitrite reductase/ring-hydroxylating ferredoxin subunit
LAHAVYGEQEIAGQKRGTDRSKGRTSDSMTTTVAEDTERTGPFKVAERDELLEGQAKIANVHGKSVALFKIEGRYFAIANACLHRGGPLGEGQVKGNEVTCPWHGWKFNLQDGSFSVIPTLRVRTYKVEENSEGIFIAV